MSCVYIAIAAVSIDGMIARYPGEPSDWTSYEDKKFLHTELDRCDAVVVGRTTYMIAKKPLAKRTCLVCTRSVETVQDVDAHCTLINLETVSLDAIVGDLGYERIAILGGSQIYSYFFAHDKVDEIYLTIEPVVFGTGVPFIGNKILSRKYHLVNTHQLNQQGTILLHYKK